MNIDDFISELKKINIDINEKQLNQLEKFYDLLVEWNKKINLTAITEKKEVYLKHFYDSLTINKIINLNDVESLCDIGTGAGFPGLVIKILFPNIKITLIDSLNKRIKFLNTVIDELNLVNIKAINDRVEDYGKKNREICEVVVARAVASLPILLEYSIPLVTKEGYFVAMKGNKEDVSDLTNAINILKIYMENKINFVLPYENSNRTLIKFKKIKETPLIYPRKYSEIKRKTL